MKKLFVILTALAAACTNPKNADQPDKVVHEHATTTPADQLNNGNKWKADQATKQNVAEMMKVVNDSSYANETQRGELYKIMQTKIDTLVSQCSMQGPDHDALHVWLEKVLKDMNEIKSGDDEYSEAFTDLKKDIENFNVQFE